MYYEEVVKAGRRITPPDEPVRNGFYFAGWTTDPEGGAIFDFDNNRSTVSMDFYAKWLKGYTFEAEFTDLEGKRGQGTSDNTSGVGLIQSVKDVLGNGTEMGMSNGYYVGKLYYNGAFLQFDINAAADVDDAVLVLRLSVDWYDMAFTDNEWQVEVNGERLQYGSPVLNGAISEAENGDMYKRPFENYVLDVPLQLHEGKNTIKLITNNSKNHGGTFNAETPLIDCLYIYSDTEVSWAECHPENVGMTMGDVSYDVTYEAKKG